MNRNIFRQWAGVFLILSCALLTPAEELKVRTVGELNAYLHKKPYSRLILISIPPGTPLEILEQKTFKKGFFITDWVKVYYKGKTGWVNVHWLKDWRGN